MLARGSLFSATWSTSASPSPPRSRHHVIAASGNPAQCFSRRNRSSSTAPTISPSTTRQAAESAWYALMPRIAVTRRHGNRRRGRLGHVSTTRTIRVVVAKPGLDGHDRGAKIIARALRDAGMEVIYTGLHQTPEQIVETAIQEDADAVGISILSGAHMTLVPRILELLRENGADDVVVVVGGTIPPDDAAALRQQGVAEVFGPGAPTTAIVEFLNARVPA